VLTAVQLRYEGRAEPISAHVDATVVVKLATTVAAPWPVGTSLAELGIELRRPLMPSAGIWLVADTTGADGLAAAQRLNSKRARRAGIVQAVPNLYLHLEWQGEPFTPNDPRFGGQWFFDNLNMTEAWGLERGSADVSIVIVDSGCDLDHPDLASKLEPGRDVVDDDDDPSYGPGEMGAAHGTACAGLAAAATNNGEGIAGACPDCRLRCVRLLTDHAVPLSATIAVYEFALQVDAAVVSNSWGYVDSVPVPQLLAEAINNLFNHGRMGKGALVLFASGNDDREINDDEIQALASVLAIGAINYFDEQTPFTNWGNTLDLVAPTGTLTTDIVGLEGDDPSDYTTLFGGTSSACPVVAGIAGLAVSAAPERTAAELYDVLIETARPAPYAQPDGEGHDPVYGYGIIEPVAALQELLGISAGEQQPDAGPLSDAAAGGSGAAAAGTGGSTRSQAGIELGGGGCQLVTPTGRSTRLWWLAGFLALLAWRRRYVGDRLRRTFRHLIMDRD